MVWAKRSDLHWSDERWNLLLSDSARTLRAAGLYDLAESWSCCHLTDGGVPRAALARIVPGGTAAVEEAASDLVLCGWWRVTNEGWQWVDWTQPTRAEVQAKREDDARRKRGNKKPPTGLRAESYRSPIGLRASRAGDPVPSRPVPSRPDPECSETPAAAALDPAGLTSEASRILGELQRHRALRPIANANVAEELALRAFEAGAKPETVAQALTELATKAGAAAAATGAWPPDLLAQRAATYIVSARTKAQAASAAALDTSTRGNVTFGSSELPPRTGT